ncbi:MAG: MFS transporter [Candidatus Dormibacteria bacterium]
MGQIPRAARAYVIAIQLAGLALTLGLLFLERDQLTNTTPGGISYVVLAGFYLVFAFATSQAPVYTPVGTRLTVNLAPLYAVTLVLPPGLAALVACTGGIDRFPSRKKGSEYQWYRFLFNRAMQALVFGSASLAFRSLAESLQTGSSLSQQISIGVGALVGIVIIAGLNPSIVILAITLSTGEPLRKTARQAMQGVWVSYGGLAPMGALLAYLSYTQGIVVTAGMVAAVGVLLVVYRDLARRSVVLEGVAQGQYVAQSRLIDKKDRSTFGHSERVGILAELVAIKMRIQPDLVEQIRIGATLHDLGKIAIPDSILHKPGKLDAEEYEIMKTHTVEGWEVLREQPMLHRAADIVRSHHENWDGSGYPDGVAGRAIPVGGRITRVIDSYDCITNVRDYRSWVRTPFESLSEITSQAGTTYDAEVVAAFTDVLVERDPRLMSLFRGPDDGEDKVGMRQVLAYRPFLKLWAAAGLSNFGDMLTTTGLALAAYGATRSTASVGLIFAARALPNLLFGLPAGGLVDRYDRKVVMVGMDVLRAVLVGLLPLLLTAPFALVLGLAFLVSCATVLFNPARSAALPDIVPSHMLQGANSAMSFIEKLTEILGYGAAAVIILIGGLPLVFVIDALTFVLSAVIVIAITFPEVILETRPSLTFRQARRDVVEGLQVVRDIKELRAIIPFSTLMVVAGSAIGPLMVPLAIDRLHAGSFGFPLLEGAIAGGAIIGALLTSILEFTRRGTSMLVGAVLMGGCVLVAALSPVLPLTMVFLAGAGIANMIYVIPMITAIQTSTESRVRGRVFALRSTLVQLGVLAGAAYAGIATSAAFGGNGTAGGALAFSGLAMVLVAIGASTSKTMRQV